MKLVAFSTKQDPQPRRGAIVESNGASRVIAIPGDWNELGDAQLAATAAYLAAANTADAPALDDVILHNPLPRPGKIICVGLNYLDHVKEVNAQAPDHPVLFSKWDNALAGPEDTIIIDGTSQKVDYEAELAFVVSKTAYNVPEDRAMDYVAGYLCANDVSARDLQFADTQWVRGKSLNGYCPLGPFIATKDEIPDPHNLRIVCRLNGNTMQDSNTTQLIYKIPALVAYISKGLTLQPGDVVLTGTPPGVGMGRNPQLWIQPGDVCEIEIEGLGVLRNPFAAA